MFFIDSKNNSGYSILSPANKYMLKVSNENLRNNRRNSNENLFKKQPPDVFYKKVFLFNKIHRKTPVPEPLFQVASLRPVTLLKRDSAKGVFL